jgi:hypothetical protein
MTDYKMLSPKDRIRQIAVDHAATADKIHLEPPINIIDRSASRIDVAMQLRIAARQAARDKELASKYGLQRVFDFALDAYILQPIPKEMPCTSLPFTTYSN